MKTIEWNDEVDRQRFGPGPWEGEPDRRQWRDEETGLPCLIVRNPMGAWCGYVGVDRDHPWFRVDYDDVEPYPDVHGGLTFSDFCHGRICHTVEPGEDQRVWWLGFDCSHSGDLTPGIAGAVGRPFPGETYKDVDYVVAQTLKLARQAREAA